MAKGRKRGSAWARRDEAGGGRTRGRRAGFWLRIVANHFNCARSSLEPLMASSVSDTAASGSSGRSSTNRCSPPRTKTPRKRTRASSWESHALLLLQRDVELDLRNFYSLNTICVAGNTWWYFRWFDQIILFNIIKGIAQVKIVYAIIKLYNTQEIFWFDICNSFLYSANNLQRIVCICWAYVSYIFLS